MKRDRAKKEKLASMSEEEQAAAAEAEDSAMEADEEDPVPEITREHFEVISLGSVAYLRKALADTLLSRL